MLAKAKGFKRFALLVASALIVLGLIAEGAVADQLSDESAFGGHINAERAARAIPSVVMDPTLQQLARSHSASMAAGGHIFHNPNLAAQVPAGWRAVGENVGVGQDVAGLHSAFMNSPGHAANVLGDYDRIGVGVVVVGSTMYVTEVFYKTASAPTAQPAASAPTKRKCRKVGRRVRCSAAKVRGKKVRRKARRR